ncbi:sulfatase [Pseudopedobacter saltans DSM 12145]|uniref:Sulfatase n=1 Tax=Pseudopedobacter saltans (strain ATCC 51119 / DSM 12145 / JCM 21818 / CCUG 39354 / LMG 10337 / NBRC 100064 / NCIMB 13643) TaxID=762903 RepID=F0SEJ9_PSESL|nr:LTA synthase family protein [Pseudopedobacter saltans]ADY51889.1 sulfatase [Pseudopedobacter saltans DSM 12145]
MLKSLAFFLRYYLFWVLFFAANRVAFELWNRTKFDGISSSEILKTFLYGLHMDTSMASYFCVIPFLTAICKWLVPKIGFPNKFLSVYTAVLSFITILITIVDFNIYTEWGSKISAKVIDLAIESPKEALASSSSSPLSFILFYFLILLGVAYILYRYIVPTGFRFKNKTGTVSKALISLLILGFTFLGIRGGWKIAPMNPSQVYFSDKPILNHSALNTNWLLMSNYVKKADTKNPFLYFSQEKADSLVKNLYTPTVDTTLRILNTDRPNIVLVIIESFTANLVKELGGEAQVTPQFSDLIKEGLLFDRIYSSSDRTDKGIIAILSAFPSQGPRSIIKENDKQEKLPSISKELAKNGYHTSFFYGGYSEFSNFKSYLLSHQFNTLIDANSFNSEDLTSKWGAYDEITVQKQLSFLKNEKQPFFSTLLTLSNHEPFALPSRGKFGDSNVADKFRSTAYYTADQLKNFVQTAKRENWYNNTIFIFVADHGHRLPKENNEIFQPERYHIPLLIYGGGLKTEFKGRKISLYGNQTDIAATLLKQLNLSHANFKYSNNLLNPISNGFSFYVWQNGFGLTTKDGAVSFDPIANRIIYTEPKDLSKNKKEQQLQNAKVLMQSVYQDYLNAKFY